jgi:hypothetical protein
MGEAANDIINGDCCPCGEWVGGGQGFQQFCSSVCERDFGGGHAEVRRPRFKSQAEYRGGMDEGYFAAMDVKVVRHQPWQFSLFHPDLPEGKKFVWYPRKGTLMFETEYGNTNMGSFLNCEDVYQEIMKKVNE